MAIDDILSEFRGEKTIELDIGEAMLIDWVLTMHTYDDRLLDWLMMHDLQNWKEQAGRVIIAGNGSIKLIKDDIKILLALIPITHRWKDLDCGYSLKVKLYKAYLGESNEDENRTQSETETSDSSSAEGKPFAP